MEYKVTYKCSSRYASDYEVDYVDAKSPDDAIAKAIESRKEISSEVDGIEIVDYFMEPGFAVFEGFELVDWFTDFSAEVA